jgi:hypothetical protein
MHLGDFAEAGRGGLEKFLEHFNDHASFEFRGQFVEAGVGGAGVGDGDGDDGLGAGR